MRFMASVHNRYHQGSGASVVELCEAALHLEASWRQSCEKSGMTYNNPKYQKSYEAWARMVVFSCLCRLVKVLNITPSPGNHVVGMSGALPLILHMSLTNMHLAFCHGVAKSQTVLVFQCHCHFDF